MMKARHIDELLSLYPQLTDLRLPLLNAVELLEGCHQAGKKILVCGNGGSAADAEHIVGELMRGFLLPRALSVKQCEALSQSAGEDGVDIARHLQQGIASVSLVSGVALPTAFANDIDAHYVFAQQVFALGQPADVLWGLSTSGNAPNVLHALRTARAFGLKTLGFTGRDGGGMAALCDVELRAPAWKTPAIQELHLPMYHAICAELENRIFAATSVNYPQGGLGPAARRPKTRFGIRRRVCYCLR